MSAVKRTAIKRTIGVGGVFAIASGAMISSGIFVLPSVAYGQAGPSIIVAYALAGLLALLGTLSIVELATGMPKAGGDYFFITRSLGPAVGTISGLLSWFALSAKSAFAIYGLSVLIASFTGLPQIVTSLSLVIVFVLINLLGAKSAAVIEIGFVAVLLAILAGLIGKGISNIELVRFRPFISGNWNSLVSTVGFVFVSFGGLVTVTSIAGEVKRPARSIPLGMVGSVVTVTVLYVMSLTVTVGVLDGPALAASSAPLAEAAGLLVGRWGFVLLSVAAAFAFITTAHAGILSASRYPYALAVDQLLPGFLGRTSGRTGVPRFSLLLTGIVVAAGSIVPLRTLISAASTIILSAYLLANLGALVMRYSRLASYRPTFRVRFTPYIQIVAIAAFVFFIIDLGWPGVTVAGSLALLSIAVYLFYGRRRHRGEYALLHLIERITNRKIAGDGLERELREIVHEKDEVALDHVDQVFHTAEVLDFPEGGLNELFTAAAGVLAAVIDMDKKSLEESLHQREKESSTAISAFVAVPHLVVERSDCFSLLCVRAKGGVTFNERFSSVKAVFVLAGSADKRTLHLQTLAALAQIAMDSRFEKEWIVARGAEQLREVLLLGERRRLAE